MGGERSADVCTPVCKKMPVGEGVLYHMCTVDKKQEGRGGVESTTLPTGNWKNKI